MRGVRRGALEIEKQLLVENDIFVGGYMRSKNAFLVVICVLILSRTLFAKACLLYLLKGTVNTFFFLQYKLR